MNAYAPVDWNDPNWGGHVHVAHNGSDVPDRHTVSEPAGDAQ